MRACYSHLTSLQSHNNPYYTQVSELEILRTQNKIESVIQEALENKVITKKEFDGMNADNKEPGRFYCNFKVHKPHEHGKAPPERPIISGSGSLTEGIATFVNHHIKEIGTKHETYLKDTPDFLRLIEKINQGQKLSSNAMLVTMDAIGLYTNIIHNEGIACMKTELNKRKNIEVPTDFILKLLHIILHNNVFEFHNTYWKQNIGAAMGSKPIPHYANTFMASIDNIIKELDKTKALLLLKRFLDDYFMIFNGSTKKLHALFVEINSVHPTIKLTRNHTTIENEPLEDRCSCDPMYSIPFLDTLCTIKEGKIKIDLYKKGHRQKPIFIAQFMSPCPDIQGYSI